MIGGIQLVLRKKGCVGNRKDIFGHEFTQLPRSNNKLTFIAPDAWGSS